MFFFCLDRRMLLLKETEDQEDEDEDEGNPLNLTDNDGQ